MNSIEHCPACGAVWHGENTCEQHFHQMLFWEAEFPDYGIVHHLMVLCYHLQHPSLYSPQGLDGAIMLLAEFVTTDISPAQIRQRMAVHVDSGSRVYTITGRDGSRGAYVNPVAWTMTAQDVVARGSDSYVDSVREWARSVHASITAANDS